jgi:restriction system protein
MVTVNLMAIPDFQTMMRPVLLAVEGDEPRSTAQIRDAVDSGLDGIVRQDALGLDLVGVQAKRYDKDKTVQRPDIQAFVGALQGAQTTRGVFVTTGRFSPGALRFAENVAMRLRLIDGEELTKLMVRYNVGVQVRETFDLKEIDEDALF